MPSKKNPSVRVNWDAGEARFIVGERLEAEYPLFKVDVLGDLKAQTAWAYEDAFEELYPLQRERVQRRLNLQRRATTETLAGQTIKSATTLRNGHVALELSDGRTLVLCSNAADVHLKVADSMQSAVAYAQERYPGTWYTAEPTVDDIAASQETEKTEAIQHWMNISPP